MLTASFSKQKEENEKLPEVPEDLELI